MHIENQEENQTEEAQGLSKFGKMGKNLVQKAQGTVSQASKRVMSLRTLSVGEALRTEGVIDDAQFAKAMELANQQVSVAQVVVEKGFASEAHVLEVLNKQFGLSLTKIDEHTEAAVKNRPKTMAERLASTRLPISIQLSVAMVALLLLTTWGLSYVILQRQSEQLYQDTLKTGKVSLSYFSNNARFLLLNNKILELNTLINDAKNVEGLVNAVIVDKKGVIAAATDTKRINTRYDMAKYEKGVVTEGDLSYYTYSSDKNQKVLNLTQKVKFGPVFLGTVHVGVSLDFINEQISRQRWFIFFMSFLFILIGVGVAIFMGLGFSRPIKQLAEATHQIGEGNLSHRVYINRNDELGDLSKAFNFMAADLYRKQLMEKSFGSYVSPEVLELILNNPENPWVKGTRNRASVVFTDVRGFTSFSETAEPEVVVESLNEYFAIGTEAVLEQGGYIDKFIGDAIMAVFGVPVSQEDHAIRAVKASFYMQERLLEAAKTKGIPLLAKVGIGLNSGDLVAGNIGSSKKMEYTVIGDTVNTASRLNHFAEAGWTVISKPTLDACDGKITVEEMPPSMVKGKSEPVRMFRVTGIKG